MKILIIEDELRIAELIKKCLTLEGHCCTTAATGEAGVDLFERENPDLIVLDWGLPGMSGLEVCTQIRHNRQARDPFILMLSARQDQQDRITGIAIGADDYLTKPFDPKELAVRVLALGRRAFRQVQEPDTLVKTAHLLIDLSTRQVAVQAGDSLKVVDLSPLEFDLLALMARHPGRVWSRTELLDAVRGIDFIGGERSIDAVVKRVRNKIAVPIIHTHINIGYSFKDEKTSSPSSTELAVPALAGKYSSSRH